VGVVMKRRSVVLSSTHVLARSRRLSAASFGDSISTTFCPSPVNCRIGANVSWRS